MNQLMAILTASTSVPVDSNLAGRMMILVIQLGVILFAAKIIGTLAEKIHIPAVIGELVSGIIIGPYLLGGIPFHGFNAGLFSMYQASAPGGAI